jgi:hypothetical protein
MASTFKTTPGVYVEEISKFPPSIAQVETAIPAFLGYTQKGEVNKPVRITSLLEYEENFGTTNAATYKKVEVNLDGVISIDRAPASTIIPSYLTYYSIVSFFANGGGPCWIIPVGLQPEDITQAPAMDVTHFQDGLKELEKLDEPTMILFPDAVKLAGADLYQGLADAALGQCNKLQDRFAVLDVKDADKEDEPGNTYFTDAVAAFRNIGAGGIDETKYGAGYAPYLKTTQVRVYQDDTVTVSITNPPTPEAIAAAEAAGDPRPPDVIVTGTLKDIKEIENGWYNKIKAYIAKEERVVIPPSGAVAGIYARIDNNRGVWKAPAGMDSGLKGVSAPMIKITSEMQGLLNVHKDAGKSINAIRAFTGKGILVWGARTLAGNDNEWRYVPVRRFFNMVEESSKKATERFVFEPNDANTWVKVRSMIENFLIVQWRAGALAGAKPEDAFFVKVGLNETMTAQDILEGYLIVEIGMAVVRPAEFIILRFSHKMQES